MMPATLYAGTAAAGVFKTTDSGMNWARTGLDAVPVHGLAIDMQETSTVYAATEIGPFKSVDAGMTWSAIIDGLASIRTPALSADSAICTVYVGTDDGVFGTDIGPVLTIHSNMCVGSAWSVVVSHAPGTTPIRLTGVSNGIPWEVPNWGATDGAGMFRQFGTFAVSTVGPHQLRVEVGGVLSNIVSFVVTNCPQ